MTQRKSKLNRDEHGRESFPVIGMGGSAGSFHAFEKFFMHMPIKSGIAFVIVMHLDKSHVIDVAGILQPVTSMTIKEALDGVQIEPDHIYIIPPGKDMGIHNGQLLLMEAARLRGAHMSIDYFFQSLAEDQQSNAVAIIFSGMGADGETGVRMVKEKLGMVMVQEPGTAEFDSMPVTAIQTNMVDYILSPEEMPVKLIQYLNHPAIREAQPESDFTLNQTSYTHLQKILMLLRANTGHDFTLYKKSTIVRRIERRIAFHQLNDYVDYINFLRENPAEIMRLFNELLIGVTKFFRDRDAFEALKGRLYPLLAEKKENDPIRIWIAGCSTGEEAYSIAMLIIEHLDTFKMAKLPKLQIFATDLDPRAIDYARSASYFSNITSEISPERLDRFFIKVNEGYVVKKEVREMIVFAQHNLIKDAPFTRLDLLCCRNVLIYLTSELQKKIIPVFHYSLNPNGLLFLGPAESVGTFVDSFTSLDNKWKIFQRNEGAAALGNMLDFPFHVANQSHKNLTIHLPIKSLKSPLAETFHKILLESFTPTSLLLSERGDILYINGQTSRFMQINSGEAIFNIHRLAKDELKYALGNALHQAWEKKDKIEVPEIKVKDGNEVYVVGFRVDYITEVPLQDMLLVTFTDYGKLKKRRSDKGKGVDPTRQGAVEELEKELIYTKQQLHSTIEQMETSLEELKSTNEELQSTNEELQSTNEEALTTKEEMQSLNEELMTINLQYQNKAEELTQLNNDMKNLLDNTEIGTIFLDNQLNILRFTPQVTRLFNVIPGDVGRSITHIVSNFEYPSLEDAIKEVIETLVGKELEVSTKKDEWYNLRIMPYRTMDNFINGAVVTFTKITPVKAMQHKLVSLLDYARNMAGLLPDAALILDKDRKVLVANDRFLELFKLKEEEMVEQPFMEIVHNKWKTDKLDELLTSSDPDSVFMQQEFQGLGLRGFFVKIQEISRDENGKTLVSLVSFKTQE
ncbi:CheR family methyltransferase [Pedobacter hartonius]|uniref:protein-glutamate O-methyltransferase n=1 Tax=Pedobacter hartonius TaxID=425514 RepID=A0A1H4B8B5_9SPHI|nr:CheR family methyltransferase [Pedobacter hartonius]SEA44465.1 two-component system, chemotaxis family, CheB/CheR fusion protein [Pedobacter hartonius]